VLGQQSWQGSDSRGMVTGAYFQLALPTLRMKAQGRGRKDAFEDTAILPRVRVSRRGRTCV